MIELASSAFHGSLQEDFVMDTIEPRAASERLAKLRERFPLPDSVPARKKLEESVRHIRGLRGTLAVRSLRSFGVLKDVHLVS